LSYQNGQSLTLLMLSLRQRSNVYGDGTSSRTDHQLSNVFVTVRSQRQLNRRWSTRAKWPCQVSVYDPKEFQPVCQSPSKWILVRLDRPTSKSLLRSAHRLSHLTNARRTRRLIQHWSLRWPEMNS